MKTTKILTIAIILFGTQAWATRYDNQTWLNITLHGTVTQDSKWGAYLELQPRYSDKQQEVFETLLRPAVYYKTDQYGTYHIGYLSRTNADNKEVEKRYWAQWSQTFNADSLKFFGRLRYELRDLSLSDKSQRLRVMGRLMKDDWVTFAGFKPLAAVELFYYFNDVEPSIKSGMKQSRNSIGLTRKFENQVTTEFLLTKNYIDSATAEDQDNNVLQIILIKEF